MKKPFKVEDWEWALLVGLIAVMIFMFTNLPK